MFALCQSWRMANIDYNVDIIQSKHVALLREVADGNTKMRNGIPGLARRGLVTDDGLYAVKVTGEGYFALRGIIRNAVVQVTEDFHLPHLHHRVGLVMEIYTHMVDADGIDQYGYVIKRARPTTTVEVMFPGVSGRWMIRRPADLKGFPEIQGSINEYWRNVC